MNFRIHCNTCFRFFQFFLIFPSSFPKFSVKTSYEKFEWYERQLHLQTSFSSSCQNLLWQKFDLPESTSSVKYGQIKTFIASSHFTQYVQNQVLREIQQQIYKNSCYLLFFLHIFRLKTELITD